MFTAYYCSPQTRVGDTAEIECPFQILHWLTERYLELGAYHLVDHEYPAHHFRGYHERNDDFAEVSPIFSLCTYFIHRQQGLLNHAN